MPIQFACACGKQLQAKDEFAGRKMRCPNCQEVLTIPDLSFSPLPPEPEAKGTMIPQPGAIPEPEPTPKPETPPEPESQPEKHVLPETPTVPEIPPAPVSPLQPPVIPEKEEVSPVFSRKEKVVAAPPPLPSEESFLNQKIAPWPTHDTKRVGAVVEDESRSGSRFLGVLLVILILGGLGFAGWYFYPQIESIAQ